MSQVTLNASTSALLDAAFLGTDAERVAKVVFNNSFAQSVIDTIGAFVTPEEVANMNQKARLHTARAARWIASGGLDLKCFDRASAFCAAVIASTSQKRVAFCDVHYVCGATGEGTSPINGVSRAKLRTVITGYTTNAGTISTQVSRSVGEKGIFTGMGIVEKVKGDKHGFTVTPEGRNHGFLIAYAMTLNSLSDSTLIEMMGDKE